MANRIPLRDSIPRGIVIGCTGGLTSVPDSGKDAGSGPWPYSGEVDIMELLGQDPGKVYGTVHWGTTTQPHLSSGGNYLLPSGRKFPDAFHLFSLEWTPDSLKWFVDGFNYHVEGSGPPFDKKFHLILNVAVGGNWPGSPDASTSFPQHMTVDYVRVYSKK